MANFYIALIFIVLLIFVTACNSFVSENRSIQQICSMAGLEYTVFECDNNELNVEYMAMNTDPNSADFLYYYYDNKGNEIVACGGESPQNLEKCTPLFKIDCKKELVICAVD